MEDSDDEPSKSGPAFRYPAEECDVLDKAALDRYRTKRTEWLHQLTGDKPHSVFSQIAGMLWNDATFRTINETRGYAFDAKRRSAALNGKLARFIDQGFVATQCLSIRKLMEPASTNARRQVISLRRVLDDIKAHADILTREHYVCHDGLPFDPEPARQRFYDGIPAATAEYVIAMPTTGPEAFDFAELCHESFDRLSRVKPTERRRDDRIHPSVFDRMNAVLEESGWEDIKNYGNKFIAHAADPHSRGVLGGQKGFSLDSLARCQEALCQVALTLYGPILWEGSSGLVPIPQFDQFDQLDAPWVDDTDLPRLQEFWNRHVKSVEAWGTVDFLTADAGV